MDPHLSKALQKFLASQYIDISPHPPLPQIKWFYRKTNQNNRNSFRHSQNVRKSLDNLLLSLRSTLVGPHLPSSREILYNRTQDSPAQPSHPIDFEDVRDCLITQKSVQMKHHNETQYQDLPELHPGQPVLFLSPAAVNLYIEGTITDPPTTPCSYMIEAQGRTYCCNRTTSSSHTQTTVLLNNICLKLYNCHYCCVKSKYFSTTVLPKCQKFMSML